MLDSRPNSGAGSQRPTPMAAAPPGVTELFP